MGPSKKVRINIIGQAWSGKTTLIEHAAEKYHGGIFRPSDVIREYAQIHRLPLRNRSDYAQYHGEMLARNPRAITDAVLDNPSSLLLIDGLRVPDHALTLIKAVGMRTVSLDCPAIVRFDRYQQASAQRKGRELGHIASLQEFIADEATDNGSDNPNHPNVTAIMNMADIIIDASAIEQEVFLQADTYIESLLA